MATRKMMCQKTSASKLAQNLLVLLLLILVCIIILSMGLEVECEGLNSNNNKLLKSFQIEFGHGFLLFEIHLILIAKSLLFNV